MSDLSTNLRLTAQRFVPINSPLHEIPIALLSRQDPVLDKILFYEDVPLFEDELHDNGESILNARIVRLGRCPTPEDHTASPLLVLM